MTIQKLSQNNCTNIIFQQENMLYNNKRDFAVFIVL